MLSDLQLHPSQVKRVVAKKTARKQTSFRLDAKLIEALQMAAQRTQRTPRQVMELVLQKGLPFIETGFLDSKEGQTLLKALEDQKKRMAEALKELETILREKQGLPPKAENKKRALGVYRLDEDLLDRVRATATKTGRNDRQIVELCLRWGVPLAETWLLLEPVMDQLISEWNQLRETIKDGSAGTLSQEAAEEKMEKTIDRVMTLAVSRLEEKSSE